ncbi:MAG: lysozyme-like domain containing protein [Wenzhouxiangella sp.]|nr:lysozyme-like domain containing protein [Wenzhouxiangella sp.]TVR97087.1 MAG: lysozyme-like domain containing protein [Wenzhouxiangellaceae bacterium]
MNRRMILIALLSILICAGCATRPPQDQDNLCNIFAENPRWYDHARASERRWGTPIAIQMAFVQQESSFRARVRPERRRHLGVIPGRRPSSARGYAQAQDPAWSDYQQATGNRRARRSNMADALDFIGWYNDVSHRRLGLAKNDAYHLYLAYHEGHTGFQRGAWRNNRQLQSIASRVDARALAYQRQLNGCEQRFRCRRWYQVRPFCQ